MGNSVMHNYSSWVYQKWEESCEEHEAFGESPLTLMEYQKTYHNFLHDEYIKEKNRERNANIRIQV